MRRYYNKYYMISALCALYYHTADLSSLIFRKYNSKLPTCQGDLNIHYHRLYHYDVCVRLRTETQ